MCSLFFLAIASTLGFFIGYFLASLLAQPKEDPQPKQGHSNNHEKEPLSHRILK